jgi:GH15 family glucan-1,4-alpha-glucosidase
LLELDVARLQVQMDSAMQEDDHLVSHAHLPRTSPGRAADALRVLRLCTYASTGAVVAAPTTSLPEAPGHDRQFDYRFTWLRDASLAVSVAALLGRSDIADGYLAFVLRQVGDTGLPRGPMTDVRGQEVPAEREVPGVAGWGGSLPIRVGNDARDQLQYDALGLLVEAVSVHLQAGARLRRDVWQVVRAVADALSADDLDRCTSGIWELREPRDLVSADIGIWIALDRAVWIARGWRPWTRRRAWLQARDAAKARVVAALDDQGGLPQAYGGGPRTADASALMAVVFRMFGREDPRASALLDATLRELDCAPFVYRYEPGGDDGFAGREGAFLPASWWAVSALAACGRLEEAQERARALDRALPALMPEEMDPESRVGLGNAPLVWSHMEAARAMYLLDAEQLRARWTVLGLTAWRTSRWLRARGG